MTNERTSLVKLKVELKDVYETLKEKSDFGDIVFSKFQRVGDAGFGLLVSEKYDFWRVNSDVAVVILIVGDKDSSEIFVTTAGGASGLIRYDLGAHKKLLNQAEKTLHKMFTKEII